MTSITISTIINAPISKVWDYWTIPAHIEKWNAASADWESFDAKNDLRVGGEFSCTMAAKDRSAQFVFGGKYSAVAKHKLIAYSMSDGRKVSVQFEASAHGVRVTETFDAENQNSLDLQRQGWQAILDNFKRYAEQR